jgi:alpha-beta hydrolase superfamily lysophospholipase
VTRGAEALELTLDAAPLPLEALDGVQLGHVLVGANRLRTIRTSPRGAARGAILYLQGIDAASCEHPLDPAHPLVRLIDGWTRAGFVTMRVDRGGVGDSEGPPPAETGLAAEIETYSAALDALLAEVDPANVFLFGHSLGGMIAPLVARRVGGVMVFGTSARPWREAIVATTERQLHLAGHRDPAERLAAWAEIHARVLRDGMTPAEIFAECPHLAYLESRECQGETVFGRHVSLFRELQARDLVAAWRALETRVLVLHGEHDWVVSEEESAEIATAARSSLRALGAIGHDMLAHANLEASFRRPGEGRWDGQVLDASLAWLRG